VTTVVESYIDQPLFFFFIPAPGGLEKRPINHSQTQAKRLSRETRNHDMMMTGIILKTEKASPFHKLREGQLLDVAVCLAVLEAHVGLLWGSSRWLMDAHAYSHTILLPFLSHNIILLECVCSICCLSPPHPAAKNTRAPQHFSFTCIKRIRHQSRRNGGFSIII